MRLVCTYIYPTTAKPLWSWNNYYYEFRAVEWDAILLHPNMVFIYLVFTTRWMVGVGIAHHVHATEWLQTTLGFSTTTFHDKCMMHIMMILCCESTIEKHNGLQKGSVPSSLKSQAVSPWRAQLWTELWVTWQEQLQSRVTMFVKSQNNRDLIVHALELDSNLSYSNCSKLRIAL